jgi:tRNA-dihydrouridine synthase 4
MLAQETVSFDCDLKPRINPLLLLRNKEDHDYLKICAPMVRYSKLPFREMIRDYGVDVCYTPMILADCFHRSKFAQEIEYQTNNSDDPIIVQFAAHNSFDLAASAEIVAKYCNGIDINCGCPQKWAINEKIGSHLMSDPELVKDMIRQVKAKISPIKMSDGSSLPCSIKIRCVSNDPRDTVEFARRAEAVGVDWIAIHGRTRKQKSSEPVDLDSIKIVKECLNIPVFANGDIFSLKDADMVVEYTKADGVMAARGLLENPAMFAGYDRTPVSAIQKYIDRAIAYGTDQFIFHQ